MGTRADFYVGRGEKAEWLGSIAYDGYPRGIDKAILKATTEKVYRIKVVKFIIGKSSGTLPAQGWPWPWEDSRTTDYAYAFDSGKVFASRFGYKWFDPLKEEPERSHKAIKKAVFPNMEKIQKVALDSQRSGIFIIGLP